MRDRLFKLLTVFIFTVSIYNAKAQQANPNNKGSVKGVLQDTVHNYSVKSATVSVYRADSTLLNYQLSNNYGEFVFGNLPLNNNYYIEVSHIGYNLFRKAFTLTSAQSAIDLKSLILKPAEITLSEVQITIPPIQMNGDTLEFNASAFKLDTNAVVEDLLRKIPNVTLWGDGQITVNGREVKSLLVNGKEFFGGDFKMATQNIPKNAVEKIQVYNVQKNEQNPLDSTLTVNVKLKKGKERAQFGKIGGGYGTTGRFELDGNMNLSRPKLQFGVIVASNNVNKIANNIRTLTANSTFKNNGINIDYQPDFRAAGINRTNTTGATFSYNFIEKPTYQDRKVLTANYFFQNRNNDVISNTETTTSIGTDSKVFDKTASNSSTLNNNHKFDSQFEYGSQTSQLTISQNLDVSSGESTSQTFRSAANQNNVQTSTNTSLGRNNFNNKNFTLNGSYNYNNYLSNTQKIRSFNTRYSLAVSETENERTDLTEFRSFIDATTNRDFNRKYNTNSSNITQQLSIELPQLKRVFFSNKRLADFDFKIGNEFRISNSKDNSDVGDFSGLTGGYNGNAYLSNNLRTNTISETPAFALTKSFNKSLSNRFNTSLSFELAAKQRFTYQDNRSDKSFQNISRSYSNFVPTASISYYKNQYGEYNNQVSLSLISDVRIPTIDQLVPLIDSTNVYRLQKGNINLREANTKNIYLSFYHTDQRGKNTFNYSVNTSVSFTQNAFTDSLFIDKQNRRTIYQVNADGYRSLSLSGDIKKALKFKTSELKINIGGSATFAKTPGYVNSQFSFSNNQNTNTYLNFNYTYKDKLAFETRANFAQSKQSSFNINYNGITLTTGFSASYNVTKKLTLNSNISLNNNKSSNSTSVNYNIWNSSITYRFLKGNNAELKLTALDLLRQNNSIINTGNANSFTFGTRNVLQQYFMATFSYYPRVFGKSAGAK